MTPRLRTLSWTAPLLFALAGCIEPIDATVPAGTLAEPIVNGMQDTNPAHEAVVALTNQWGGHFCSGTLIAPDVVLTAAHCIEGRSASNTFAFFGLNANTGQGDYIAAAEVIAHEDYSSWQLVADIAVVLLAEPATVTPIPALPAEIGLTSADEGATVEFSGYGRTETGSGGVRMHVSGSVGLVCPGPSSCGGGQVVPRAFYYNMFPGGPCSGDSGGPALIVRDGQEYVAGITSYGDGGCTQFGVSTTASAYADWLEPFLGPVELCTNGVDDDGDGFVDCDDASCGGHFDCRGPDACHAPPMIGCGDDLSGSTVGGATFFGVNGCSTMSSWDGPEVVYELGAPAGAEVTIDLIPTGAGDPDLFLLPPAASGCDPSACIAGSMEWGTTSESLTLTMPGNRRFLMVETWDTPDSFNISVRCAGMNTPTPDPDPDPSPTPDPTPDPGPGVDPTPGPGIDPDPGQNPDPTQRPVTPRPRAQIDSGGCAATPSGHFGWLAVLLLAAPMRRRYSRRTVRDGSNR